jgi:hypothetical protein
MRHTVFFPFCAHVSLNVILQRFGTWTYLTGRRLEILLPSLVALVATSHIVFTTSLNELFGYALWYALSRRAEAQNFASRFTLYGFF